VSDFVIWGPGETLTCILCGNVRGGVDPPGPWQRHYGSARRRVPIFGNHSILGYLEYINP
jgi:hypothetical protein